MESINIKNISVFEPILTVSLSSALNEALVQMMDVAQKEDLPYPTLIASTSTPDGSSRLMITGHKDWIGQLFTALLEQPFVTNVVQEHFGIMVQGHGLENGSALVDLVKNFQSFGVKIDKCIKEPHGILFSFHNSEREKALQFLASNNFMS